MPVQKEDQSEIAPPNARHVGHFRQGVNAAAGEPAARARAMPRVAGTDCAEVVSHASNSQTTVTDSSNIGHTGLASGDVVRARRLGPRRHRVARLRQRRRSLSKWLPQWRDLFTGHGEWLAV